MACCLLTDTENSHAKIKKWVLVLVCGWKEAEDSPLHPYSIRGLQRAVSATPHN